jgi:tetratricopeptide (TPR) repeat protein
MSIRSLLFVAACAGALASACATRNADRASAATLTSSRASDAASKDLTIGRYEDALLRANRAIAASPRDPWARYDRAVALRHLERTDAAVAAFREAEAAFGPDRNGIAISIYGRARALHDARRCEEATAAYREYASFVRRSDPTSADMAMAYAKECRPASPPPIDDAAMTELTSAILARCDEDALRAADRTSEASRASGWVDYNRAVALAAESRTDEALSAYDEAARRFVGRDPHAVTLALYGRARALDQAGRCADAKREYQAYAEMVRATDPRAAALATTYAAACRPK